MDKVLKPQIVSYVEKGVMEDKSIAEMVKMHAMRRHFYALARDLRELARIVQDCAIFFDRSGEQMFTCFETDFLVRDLLALAIICEQAAEENKKKEGF